MASEPTKPVSAKPTIKLGGGKDVVAPAGVGSVAAPVKKTDSVRQPAATPLPQQTPKTPGAKSASPQFELPAAVYSPQLLESVIYDIERYLDWYRQSQIQKRVHAPHPSEEPTHSAETVLVIEAWLAGKPATVETLEKLIAHLRGLKLPQVHLMLAALPNRAQREALVSWFRNNVGTGLLLSFVADRNLGGGVVVRTPNRVFDFTWKQQLIAGRGKLAEILKRV
jgi:hypothetical protein